MLRQKHEQQSTLEILGARRPDGFFGCFTSARRLPFTIDPLPALKITPPHTFMVCISL